MITLSGCVIFDVAPVTKLMPRCSEWWRRVIPKLLQRDSVRACNPIQTSSYCRNRVLPVMMPRPGAEVPPDEQRPSTSFQVTVGLHPLPPHATIMMILVYSKVTIIIHYILYITKVQTQDTQIIIAAHLSIARTS